jgi:hypothetical protein
MIFFNPSEPIYLPLADFLSETVGLDFTEVNSQGDFPLSIALRNSETHTVMYLLRRKMIPSKEVLLQYRHHGPYRTDTILTLLFCVHLWLREEASSLDTLDTNVAEMLKEMCQRIGEDVICELSKIEVELWVRNPLMDDESTKLSTLPLALACQHWPLPAIEYLVENLCVEGSVVGTVAHKKVLECVEGREDVLHYFNGRLPEQHRT